MLYFFRSKRYADIIDRHNDIARDGYATPSDMSDSASCGESSDSSLEGRLRWRPTRFSNHGNSKIPKKYRSSWRL